MQFKSFAYLLTIAAVASAQTATAILNNLATLKTQVTTLDNAIKAFPSSGGTLTQALAIHTDAQNVQSATDTTTNSTHGVPAPLSESDGQSVITAVGGIVPLIQDALTGIVTKKPAIDALPLGGLSSLVRQDLAALNTSTSALESALIALSPADLVGQATTLKNEVNSAFATAIAAYAA